MTCAEYDEYVASASWYARCVRLREALEAARHWHEQLDYDEALNVIDGVLVSQSLATPPEPGEGVEA